MERDFGEAKEQLTTWVDGFITGGPLTLEKFLEATNIFPPVFAALTILEVKDDKPVESVSTTELNFDEVMAVYAAMSLLNLKMTRGAMMFIAMASKNIEEAKMYMTAIKHTFVAVDVMNEGLCRLAHVLDVFGETWPDKAFLDKMWVEQKIHRSLYACDNLLDLPMDESWFMMTPEELEAMSHT